MALGGAAKILSSALSAGAKSAGKKSGSKFLQDFVRYTKDSLVPNIGFGLLMTGMNAPQLIGSEEGRKMLMADAINSVVGGTIGAATGGFAQAGASKMFPGRKQFGILASTNKPFDEFNSITRKAKIAPIDINSSNRDIGKALRAAQQQLGPDDISRLNKLHGNVNSIVQDFPVNPMRYMGSEILPSNVGRSAGIAGDIIGSMGGYNLSSKLTDSLGLKVNPGLAPQADTIDQQLVNGYRDTSDFTYSPGTMYNVGDESAFEDMLISVLQQADDYPDVSLYGTSMPFTDEVLGSYRYV